MSRQQSDAAYRFRLAIWYILWPLTLLVLLVPLLVASALGGAFTASVLFMKDWLKHWRNF